MSADDDVKRRRCVRPDGYICFPPLLHYTFLAPPRRRRRACFPSPPPLRASGARGCLASTLSLVFVCDDDENASALPWAGHQPGVSARERTRLKQQHLCFAFACLALQARVCFFKAEACFFGVTLSILNQRRAKKLKAAVLLCALFCKKAHKSTWPRGRRAEWGREWRSVKSCCAFLCCAFFCLPFLRAGFVAGTPLPTR